MFKEIEAVPNLPAQEKETNQYWKQLDIVQKLKRERSNNPTKVYYDGPITANGVPHYGHAITWTLKDIIPRFWTMQGYYVERNMGWDCQGIPVEYEVEKDLKLTKKEDIEQSIGVEKFNELCRKSVQKYQGTVLEYETLLGRWIDPDATYSTMEPKYIESMWWSLSELYKKGLLYEGHKVVAYSTRAGTSLSTHEVSEGGYKDVEDTFVTVKFKLKSQDNTYFLAWTTTPWTVPGNLMLAVNKELDYVRVEVDDANYILAKDRVTDVFKDKSVAVLQTYKGAQLEALEYEPPFNLFENKRAAGCFKVILSPHATAEDGTGIVHLAPYGEEDFEIFMKLGISLFDYLDETANFTELVPQYKGLFYKTANPKIVEDLRSAGVLFNTGTLIHRMPMCWRTKTPLIYKPIKSWYVAVTKIKEKMLAENNKMGWKPDFIKDRNSAMWIQNARDWALSRNRYWGTPLPVWVNDKTGEKIFISSFEELEKKSGVKLANPHRPFVDQITWSDSSDNKGGNGGTFIRVKDVIDVWYDSGSMPFARHHYPFENIEQFNKTMPAEYIAEGPDQVRLWFYVMHVLGVALFDKAPYKNVVTIGMMLDESGKKMSKSSKNYKPLDEVLDEYGADTLRYYILTSSIVSGTDAAFTPDMLKQARKELFLPLWNSTKYFITYANIYNFKPTLDKPHSENILDKWIMARLKEAINNVTADLENYEILAACKQFEPFVTDLSTWYVRRSRDRIKDGDMDALATLYYVLSQFIKLIAPLTPFFSESLYELLQLRDLTKLESVHLDTFPKSVALSTQESKILETMTTTRKIVSAALAIRVEKNIKIRQPLQSLHVLSTSDYFKDLILDEINVKEVKDGAPATTTNPVWLDTTLTDELKLEGELRDFVRQIQDLRKEQKLAVSDKINVTYFKSIENEKIVAKFSSKIMQKVLANQLIAGDSFKVDKC